MKSPCLFIILAAFMVSGCAKENLLQRKEILMGTFVELSCLGDSVVCEEGTDKAFNEIKRVEDLLSNFKNSSEVSSINKRAGRNLVKVGKETIEIIRKAKIFFEASDGAFDITVAPLLKLWGFYDRDMPLTSLPDIRIKEKLPLIGSDKLIISASGDKVGFKLPGMSIDLGGIAKGYAVDRAKEILLKRGVRNALINAGGDIFCLGTGQGREGWKIGIQHPLKAGEIIAVLNLENKAIATSGSYENFVEIQNKHFSHMLNPKTGYPVENDLLSVTVVTDDCLSADALATAVFVLGKKRGEELLKKFNAQAMLISKTEKGLGFLITEGLRQNIRIDY